jgi:opacity protein-like surface antigen
MGTRFALPLAAVAALGAAEDAAAQFYIQLDTGWSWAQNAKMTDTQPSSPDCLLQGGGSPSAGGNICTGTLNHLGSSFIIGGGVGYKLPMGFRVDITYTSRSGYNLSGSDPAGTNFDPKTTASTGMANVYYDLPFKIAERVTPYIGGGIGRTKNKVNNINWNDPAFPGSSGQVPGGSKNSTAWQLTLGADVRITRNWVIDVGYRYVDLGKLSTNSGAATSGQPFNANNFTTPIEGKLKANEFLFNVRYEL